MNETDILTIIKNKIGCNYIGDDCAYLKDFGIVVTQDSLVEDIHFKREWCSPYQIGYKSAAVNISDILASGAIPKYILIALSLPNNVDECFIDEFYNGVKSALFGASVVGGDITGSADKIMISITAIGDTKSRNISSRKNAKIGYKIITTGNYGSSAAGLEELENNGSDMELINAHLEPKLNFEFSKLISTLIKEPYAMMDSSDGLADALFKIAEASNVRINIDYGKIKHLSSVNEHQVIFGGEDYNLVAAVPEKYLSKIQDACVIGDVTAFNGVRLNINGYEYKDYSELDVYNHFGE